MHVMKRLLAPNELTRIEEREGEAGTDTRPTLSCYRCLKTQRTGTASKYVLMLILREK